VVCSLQGNNVGLYSYQILGVVGGDILIYFNLCVKILLFQMGAKSFFAQALFLKLPSILMVTSCTAIIAIYTFMVVCC